MQVDSGVYVFDRNNDKDRIVVGSSVLLNPASYNYDLIKELEKKVNEDRIASGKNSICMIKDYTFEGGLYKQVNCSNVISFGESTDKMIQRNGEMVIQLLFLSEIIKNYDENYNINYNVTKHM